MRNKALELNNIGTGKWITTDKRFGVVMRKYPINAMTPSFNFKIKRVYEIKSFEDYNGPREFPELAPTIGRVDVYRKVFPWLGVYTGEGSFKKGDPAVTGR